MKSRSLLLVFAFILIAALALTACQPQVIEKTVEVEKIVEATVVVEKEVEVEVEKTVVVEKEVEVAAVDEREAAKEFLAGKKICGAFPGPVNDAGWTTQAYVALNNLRDNYRMEYAYREHVLPEETSDVLREYAESGCDVLFAHGFEYLDQINEVALEYPDKQFIQTSRGFGQEPNVVGLSFKSGEEGYFAGLTACQVSQTHKVGYIVGQTYPNLQWNQEQANAAADWLIEQGKIESCEIEWLEVGNWADPAKAKELTAAGIEQGIDVFIMVADAGDSGVVEAIAEAREAGSDVWAVSGVKDKNYLGPEFVMGGYEELVWMEVELAMLEYAKNGAPVGVGLPTGMREGSITWNPDYGIMEPEAAAEVFEIYQCYIDEGEECDMLGDINIRTDL